MALENDPRFTPPLESGEENTSVTGGDREGSAGQRGVEMSEGDLEWLTIARDAWRSSEHWFDTSARTTFERALSNFRSVHPAGSKYHKDAYLKKSRLFRPKTRSAIRRLEAANAIAFFSTEDIVHCTPLNETDPQQQLGAEVHNALLNQRLNDPHLRMFQTLIGGCQDGTVTGVVVSKQFWNYESRTQNYQYEYEDEDPETGEVRTLTEQGEEEKVLQDHPEIWLLPVENFRFDPAADWRDPVNSSPYTIELQPTYIFEIKERIKRGQYRDIPTEMLGAALKQDWDSVRKHREGQRIDKYDTDTHFHDYRTVWVHHYIVRHGGQDFVYDTLGVEFLLSDPKPIEDVYRHCTTADRPYVMGMSIIESHKTYPSGVPQIMEDLQEEANDIANLRLDNVKHAINKRWFVKRGRGVDLRALVRNVAGSAVLMSDPNQDVREIATREVTGSAFHEQDRINADVDDVVGTFSQGSVSTNRQMNETVGGMNMLSQDASVLTEYMIRTLAETWVAPVMRQLVRLEAAYEDDASMLRVISSRLKTRMVDVLQAMQQPVNVQVNVGFNSTNPQKRVERLSLGLATVANFMPDLMQGLDRAETVKEIFGALGHRDGSRFFPWLSGDVDPHVQALTEQNQQLQAALESKQMEKQIDAESRQMVAQIGAQARVATERIKQETQIMLAEAKGDVEVWKEQMKGRLEEIDRMLETEKTDIKRRELWLQREALSHTIQQADREFMLKMEQMREGREQAAAGGGDRPQGGDPGQGAYDLPGNDKAGVISREHYDLIPQNEQ